MSQCFIGLNINIVWRIYLKCLIIPKNQAIWKAFDSLFSMSFTFVVIEIGHDKVLLENSMVICKVQHYYL